jgi:hypothetical protein
MFDRKTKEKRSEVRSPSPAKVKVTWTDEQGGAAWQLARCVEISKSGMRLDAETPIAARTPVRFDSTELKLAGTGVVRHCTRKGIRVHLGVEFSSGVVWTDPAAGAGGGGKPDSCR